MADVKVLFEPQANVSGDPERAAQGFGRVSRENAPAFDPVREADAAVAFFNAHGYVVEAAENLKRGIDSLPPPSDDQPAIVTKVREGLEGVERSFVGTLERNGIKRDDPVGQAFDPNLHQAMAEQETTEHPPGTVLQAWSAAWTLNGRLLRPAMVVVAKAPPVELPAAQKLDTTA